jgi:hypothetical protein
MRNNVFVVTSHVEVEIGNWSSEVVKVFTDHGKALEFRKILVNQAEDNETIEIDTVEFE